MKIIVLVTTFTLFISCGESEEPNSLQSALPETLQRGPIISDYTPEERISAQTNYVFENQDNNVKSYDKSKIEVSINDIEILADILNKNINSQNITISLSEIGNKSTDTDQVIDENDLSYEFLAYENNLTRKPNLLMMVKLAEASNINPANKDLVKNIDWDCGKTKVDLSKFDDPQNLIKALERLQFTPKEGKQQIALPMQNTNTKQKRKVVNEELDINLNFHQSKDQLINADKLPKSSIKQIVGFQDDSDFSFTCLLNF